MSKNSKKSNAKKPHAKKSNSEKSKATKSSISKPLEFLTDKSLRKAIKAQAKSRSVPVATLLTEIVTEAITAQINHNPSMTTQQDLSGVRIPIPRDQEHMVMKPRHIRSNTHLEDRLIRLQCDTTLTRLLLTHLCQHLLPSLNLNAVLETLRPEVQRLLEDPLLELEAYRAIKEEPVSDQLESLHRWPV